MLPAARDDRERFLEMFWGSLGAQERVLQTVEGVEPFGFTKGCWRWVEVSSALWIERRPPVGSWVLVEGFWRLGSGSGGLWREMVVGLVLDRIPA